MLLTDIKSFKLHKDVFIHSDQGCYYTSLIFQKFLKYHNIDQSMSIRGDYWDNAPKEYFFGHMKDEIEYRSCTLDELKLIVDDYMDYYNSYKYQ